DERAHCGAGPAGHFVLPLLPRHRCPLLVHDQDTHQALDFCWWLSETSADGARMVALERALRLHPPVQHVIMLLGVVGCVVGRCWRWLLKAMPRQVAYELVLLALESAVALQ